MKRYFRDIDLFSESELHQITYYCTLGVDGLRVSDTHILFFLILKSNNFILFTFCVRFVALLVRIQSEIK